MTILELGPQNEPPAMSKNPSVEPGSRKNLYIHAPIYVNGQTARSIKNKTPIFEKNFTIPHFLTKYIIASASSQKIIAKGNEQARKYNDTFKLNIAPKQTNTARA